MDVDFSQGLEETLELAKMGPSGSRWSVPEEQADELIAKLALEMDKSQSAMGDAVRTTFEYEGETMCLELRWSGGFNVYAVK